LCWGSNLGKTVHLGLALRVGKLCLCTGYWGYGVPKAILAHMYSQFNSEHLMNAVYHWLSQTHILVWCSKFYSRWGQSAHRCKQE
jgi:hypothetical protein